MSTSPDPRAGDSGPPKGLPAFKAHLAANKIDVAMWGIRLLTVIMFFNYVFPLFMSEDSAFYKVLLGNAAISALRLHQRIPPQEIALPREFLARLFLKDSAHSLFYSLIFISSIEDSSDTFGRIVVKRLLHSDNCADSAFYKALLGNAAISALRLHQRIPPQEIALSREFLARLFLEDSAHYLFYSLIFMSAAPSIVILLPIFLFAFLHAASYSLTILDTLGQNSIPIARLLIALVEFKSRDILIYAAFIELMLFPYVIFLTFLGQCGLMTPFVYYYFVSWRYASRRNPYTRNTCRELRMRADAVAASPRCPAVVRGLLQNAVQLACRMAPVDTAQ